MLASRACVCMQHGPYYVKGRLGGSQRRGSGLQNVLYLRCANTLSTRFLSAASSVILGTVRGGGAFWTRCLVLGRVYVASDDWASASALAADMDPPLVDLPTRCLLDAISRSRNSLG